jgi:hypothetical protein
MWDAGSVDHRYDHLSPWSMAQVAIAPDGSKVSFELTQEAMVEPPRWWWLLALFRRSETQGSGWSLTRTDDGIETRQRFEHWDGAVSAMRSAIASIESGEG